MASRNHGFTLIEAMVTIAIVSIIAAVATPAYQGFIESRRLVGATELISSQVNLAKSEALKQSKPIFLGLSSGAGWSIGFGDTANCDGTNSAQCIVSTSVNGANNQQITYFITPNYPGISIGAASQVRFDPVRGLATNAAGVPTAASISISSPSGASTQVNVSILGRVSSCAVGNKAGGLATCN